MLSRQLYHCRSCSCTFWSDITAQHCATCVRQKLQSSLKKSILPWAVNRNKAVTSQLYHEKITVPANPTIDRVKSGLTVASDYNVNENEPQQIAQAPLVEENHSSAKINSVGWECLICQGLFDFENDAQKDSHLDVCVDTFELTCANAMAPTLRPAMIVSQTQRLAQGIRAVNFFCVVCDVDLSKRQLRTRCQHLKVSEPVSSQSIISYCFVICNENAFCILS